MVYHQSRAEKEHTAVRTLHIQRPRLAPKHASECGGRRHELQPQYARHRKEGAQGHSRSAKLLCILPQASCKQRSNPSPLAGKQHHHTVWGTTALNCRCARRDYVQILVRGFRCTIQASSTDLVLRLHILEPFHDRRECFIFRLIISSKNFWYHLCSSKLMRKRKSCIFERSGSSRPRRNPPAHVSLAHALLPQFQLLSIRCVPPFHRRLLCCWHLECGQARPPWHQSRQVTAQAKKLWNSLRDLSANKLLCPSHLPWHLPHQSTSKQTESSNIAR